MGIRAGRRGVLGEEGGQKDGGNVKTRTRIPPAQAGCSTRQDLELLADFFADLKALTLILAKVLERKSRIFQNLKKQSPREISCVNGNY